MRNKKSAFFTFIFSLIPGAGEMYMGFFKQGLSLMGLCVLVGILGSVLGISEIILFLPLIWFYSFFHVHHLRGLPPEEFHAVEDRWLFLKDEDIDFDTNGLKNRKVFAIVLLVLGVWMLWNVCMDGLVWIMPDFLHHLIWGMQSIIPRILIALVILYVGFCMLRGKKVMDGREDHHQGGE